MPPLRANYDYEGLKKELAKVGVVVLEVFPDGQVRWGDQPMPAKPEKFKGRSVMTAPYIWRDGNQPRFDIFTIRNILERLGKTAYKPVLEKALEQYMY
jgi:hypothetical protein